MNKLLFLLVAALAACATSSPTPTSPVSTWGDIFTVGQAEQMDAPSFWPFSDRLTAAWIGADETGIHQDIRILTEEGMSETVVLPLPPQNPYAQQLYPAYDERVHLLWLDAGEDGQVQLYNAVVTPELTVERGPTQVTEQTTRRYVAIPNGDGSLWTIASGGLVVEPSLFAHYIDPQGRPRLGDTRLISHDADWPAVAQQRDGTVYLFWIRPSTGEVMRSTLANGLAANIQPITETIALNPGDRLINFSAGLDRSHFYLFWNVKRADGEDETWFTSGTMDASSWDQPVQLGFDTTKGQFESGFNSGTVGAARAGNNWVSWLTVLAGHFDTLVAATVYDRKLGILYLQDGTVAGYQEIAAIHDLIGLPSLHTDRDRFLYMAWSEPNSSGMADLNVTMSKQF